MMMLYEEEMEPCFIIDKTTTPDGYGGVITIYSKGAGIQAAFSFNDTTQARIASVQGADDNFKIFTKKQVVLRAGDIIQRVSNQKTYQITSNGDDNKTPAMAMLDAREVNAKEWEVTVSG